MVPFFTTNFMFFIFFIPEPTQQLYHCSVHHRWRHR